MSARVEVPSPIAPGRTVDAEVRFEGDIAKAEIAVEWIAARVEAQEADPVVVHFETIDEPRASGSLHAVRFRVPLAPSSYRGRHFSVSWRLLVRTTRPDGRRDTEIVDLDVR